MAVATLLALPRVCDGDEMLRVPLGTMFHCATLNARFLGRFLLAFGDASDILPDSQVDSVCNSA